VKLRVFTPTEVVFEDEVAHVTVEDPTGSLGIRPGHAPLVTPLVQGILVARAADGRERYLALDGGVALVNRDVMEVVSRQAVESDDLAHLEETVLGEFERRADEEKSSFVAFEKMRLSFMRRLLELEKG
jgi:F-type H+-transporting ATPase subunit epsilon